MKYLVRPGLFQRVQVRLVVRGDRHPASVAVRAQRGDEGAIDVSIGQGADHPARLSQRQAGGQFRVLGVAKAHVQAVATGEPHRLGVEIHTQSGDPLLVQTPHQPPARPSPNRMISAAASGWGAAKCSRNGVRRSNSLSQGFNLSYKAWPFNTR